MTTDPNANRGPADLKRLLNVQDTIRRRLAPVEAERDRLREINAELLAALEGLLTCSLPQDVSGRRIVEQARAAIAKARQ